jgi:hypothetical protein
VQAVLWPSQITHVHTALGEEKKFQNRAKPGMSIETKYKMVYIYGLLSANIIIHILCKL